MNFLESLPEHLLSRAVKLIDLGINNCAWSNKDALDVIAEMVEQGLAILGGDVLRLTEKAAVQSTHDSWYLNKRPEWSWSEYVMQSGNHAQNYILSYVERNKGKSFVFSFVVTNEEQFERLKTGSS